MNSASAPATPDNVAQDDAIRVLVVDDALVIRGMLSRILEEAGDISVVASAADGESALARLKRNEVDVVVLDIEMPKMDGITALPLIVEQYPDIQVIMASTLTKRNAEISLKALSLGAADYVTKPSSSGELHGADAFKQELQSKVRTLGKAARRRARRTAPTPQFRAAKSMPAPRGSSNAARSAAAAPSIALRALHPFTPDAIAIGSSTGGPQALMRVITDIADIPQPIFITQHMPATFTSILAEHISRTSRRTCIEATDGLSVEGNKIYLAPGDRHMLVKRQGARPVITLSDSPPENFCRPAVDPMLRSLSSVYGGKLLVTILTGMGSDGAKGATVCADAGAQILAQDEATSVVWGMPGAVARAGICGAVLPLGEIGSIIRNFAVNGGKS
ncbi:MAG: chemotaxis response regulator protein-glutamate methylesterase [Alphaproteobacteria bacterium]